MTGIIWGACFFHDEYDGYTIGQSLEQVWRLTGTRIKKLAGDRGYRGNKEINSTQILIPDTPKAKDSYTFLTKQHISVQKLAVYNNLS